MTVREALHTFIAALELTPGQQEAVSRQHTFLRESLSQKLPLNPDFNTFLTGSYARSTAVRPLDDIDVFCVLRPTPELNASVHGPDRGLAAVEAALRATYPAKDVHRQNRSVNIAFTTTGVAYDVVPAFADPSANGEVFRIPDTRARAWIRSNPRVHALLSVEANARAGQELKPLIRALKHWNRGLPEPARLRSFLLEVMAWEILTFPPRDRLSGLVSLFEGLANRIQRPTPDPAGLGEPLDADLGPAERAAAAGRFAGAASQLRSAAGFAEFHRTEDAHAVLFRLFGQPYPERGRDEAAWGRC